MNFFKTILCLSAILIIAGCSTNPATGENQFTGFLPASSEAKIGAQEHEKILKAYGGVTDNKKLQNYVTRVGQKIVPHTERKDVKYTFTLLDSPVVNAFALPGGYVYVTRGLLALANNEAQLAAVIGHEIGHVTARHSAERYSHSVLTSLGASILAASVNSPGVSQAAGLGANLYLSSYSRSQEHQADDLGVRYLSRAGYDPKAMSDFLKNLQASANLEAKEAGKKNNKEKPNYFASHPLTSKRVLAAASAASQYPKNQTQHKTAFMNAINGMIFGDNSKQGFMVGEKFIHPELGFTFTFPKNYRIKNSSSEILALSKRQNGPAIIFTGSRKKHDQNIEQFLIQKILKGDLSSVTGLENININGRKAITAQKKGQLNKKSATIRYIAVEWSPKDVYLFTLAIPQGTTEKEINDLKRVSYSLKTLTTAEKKRYKPKRIMIYTAKPGDTITSLSRRFPYKDKLNPLRFRTYNGLSLQDKIKTGQQYKIVIQ